MYADFIFEDKRANELYNEIREHLKGIDNCYCELRNMGVVVFASDKENPSTKEE